MKLVLKIAAGVILAVIICVVSLVALRVHFEDQDTGEKQHQQFCQQLRDQHATPEQLEKVGCKP
jgi:hypothetical protein